ncbi:MAG: hypothetical protein IIT78_01765 [Mycoplasmataceae bacterium]|nr:hypothetical protein [Mycoplasmataceae bacterium]
MKKVIKRVCKFLFLCISCLSLISVISCSFFSLNTQWLKSKQSNQSLGSNQDINYASYSSLINQYNQDLISIKTNWVNNFQIQNPKWNNFNTNLLTQLTYEQSQWQSINKNNIAKYLATLYPLLWSLNNALINLDWYFINAYLVGFINSLNNSSLQEFSFLPSLSTSTSYISSLSKLDWTEILLNPKWLIFKHDFKKFLIKQNLSINTWNDDLEVFCGSWANDSWALSSTYSNISIVNLGFVSFNWYMMNEQIPSCFSSSNKNLNLNVNNWSYFNDTQNNQNLSQSNLKKQITYYEQIQTFYDCTIKHLSFISKG